MSGIIDDGMAAQFAALVDDSRLKEVVQRYAGPEVQLNSRGGSVLAAMRIGEAIRRANFWTGVYEHATCASACVLILAAGVHRTAKWGTVIIHRPRFDEELFANLPPDKARAQYDQMAEGIRAYLAKMGMADSLFRDMLKVPSDDGRRLSVIDLRSYGLDGEDAGWAEWKRARLVQTFGREDYETNQAWGELLAACAGASQINLDIAIGQCADKLRSPFVARIDACAARAGQDRGACAKTVARQMAAKYR